MCPYEEFRKTKNDLGSCSKEHDAQCLQEWNRLSDREKDSYGYERDLLRWLDKLLVDLKKRKEANLAKINAPPKTEYAAEDQAALDNMARRIEEHLIEAQIQGELGQVDACESLVEQAEKIREQRDSVQRAADAKIGKVLSKGLVQTICPISGLILNDEEARLKDHHSGRNYNAWKKVHEKHAELEETFRKRRQTRSSGTSRSPGRDKRQERQKSTERNHASVAGRNEKVEQQMVDDSDEEEGQI